MLSDGSLLPRFSVQGRSYIAYGRGREHLIPTVADYNGDGYLDILAGDREGSIGVYLNPGASWPEPSVLAATFRCVGLACPNVNPSQKR